jgi:dienelactone hydrolase
MTASDATAYESAHESMHESTRESVPAESAPGPAAIALAVVGQFEAGHFDEAAARFSPRLREAAPAATVAGLWRDGLAGRPVRERGPVSLRLRPDGLVTATVPVRTEGGGGLDVLMSLDDEGTMQGLRFTAPGDTAWTAPGYADPERFREYEVVVGSGTGSVPGTMTIPHGRRGRRGRRRDRFPAIVLLAGSGPFDRDATAGPNKPLKDLAWGLATQGIATLRFDKPTFTRAEEWNKRGFTLTQEYVPHAVKAVKLLQIQPTVDADRVFVLGHSAGGKIAPRVAEAEPSVRGLILLAGDAAPLHEAAVRVARHVASLNPGREADGAVAMITELAARAADPGLDPRTPAERLPFGLPAAYWLDLLRYDAVGTAAAVHKPMFIAQGGRDYQVTEEEDFSLWREGLRGRPDVEFRLYPADDHLFFPGTEPATPASYQLAQHVDAELIADIAAWTGSPRGRR